LDGTGEAYVDHRVFAAAALKGHTYRGARVTFDFSQTWYFTNDPAIPTRIDVNFGDGLGLRTVGFGERSVAYATTGRKVVEVRMYFEEGGVPCGVLRGSFSFDVRALETPAPDDTLAVTAAIPYNGQYGSGEAYVYLSDQHATLTNPVVVVEGFDFDNDMNWEELYALLNQQGLAESLRADGFDAVVLNFADATDYIQKNSFVVVTLIQQVNAAIGTCGNLAVVGASMGGVAARYALAYMEAHELEHQTRTLVSFDSPQKGASIPLGLQYWVKFFSSQSEEAADMLDGLNAPAARQLLVYHLTDPPGATGEPDPLRASFLADLSAVGDYPVGPRKVAVANGSGLRANQGFPAGDQIIFYEYNSFLWT
jgi:pimeloyl-ACP methyl ester carboxylesterase